MQQDRKEWDGIAKMWGVFVLCRSTSMLFGLAISAYMLRLYPSCSRFRVGRGIILAPFIPIACHPDVKLHVFMYISSSLL